MRKKNKKFILVDFSIFEALEKRIDPTSIESVRFSNFVSKKVKNERRKVTEAVNVTNVSEILRQNIQAMIEN